MVTAMAEMATSTLLAKELIRSFEGLSLKAYCCPGGAKTIGYGHVIAPHEQIGDVITEGRARELLEQDVAKAKAALHRLCQVPLTMEQEAALLSFIFNCGSGAFQASTLRQKLLRGEHAQAADEFLKWSYAGGIKLRGLVRRRMAERSLFLAGSNRNYVSSIKPATESPGSHYLTSFKNLAAKYLSAIFLNRVAVTKRSYLNKR